MKWLEAFKAFKKATDAQKSNKDKPDEEKEQEALTLKVKKKVKVIVSAALTWVGTQVAALMAMMGSILAVVLAIALLLTTLIGALVGTMGTDDSFGLFGDLGGGGVYTAGERYVFSMADYNKLKTPYLKNLYMHMWLCENVKDLTGATVSVAQMVGIPTLENGSSYFTMVHAAAGTKVDGKLPEELSVAEYASGMTSTALQYRGIYQHYLYYDSETFASKVKGLMKKFGFEEKDMWTNISIHKNPLSTASYDSRSIRENDVNSYCDGNVMYSPYNLAALILATIGNTMEMEGYMNKEITPESWGSHKFANGYAKALEHYGYDDTPELRAYVKNTAYYSVHAGGAWKWFNDYKSYETYIDAQIDYLVFCYKNFRGIRLKEEYMTEAYVTTMDAYTIRNIGMGDANANFARSNMVYEFCAPTAAGVYELNGKTVEMSLRGAWEQQMKAEGKQSYLDAIETAMESPLLGKGICPYRQNTYAFSCGPAIEAAGQAKIDLIGSQLGYIFVTDYTSGHICHAESSSNNVYNSNIPPTGHYDWKGKTFENTKYNHTDAKGVVRSLSNVRNDEWFVKLDETEWTDPLNSDKSNKTTGGIKVNSRFGYRYWDEKVEFHGGIDLGYNVSYESVAEWRKYYPVYAMHDGEVTQVRTSPGSTTGRLIAYKVTYKRDGELVTRYITYMHLSAIEDSVKEGAKLKKGQLVGYMGGSGVGETSYGKHLHLQLSTSSTANGRYGVVDIETEIPFLTLYDRYGSWATVPSSQNSMSGFLLHQQEWDLQGEYDYDPQSIAPHTGKANNIVNAPKS